MGGHSWRALTISPLLPDPGMTNEIHAGHKETSEGLAVRVILY
jgi:hypothetical protein